MEERLTEWLLDNRPYTHLSHRVKQFCLYAQGLAPGLSYAAIRREVIPIVGRLMLGEVGHIWQRDRCYERVLRLYGFNDQRTDGWHAKRGEMVTASEVYGVFGSDSARRDVMIRKLETRPPGESSAIPALLWGTRFEPVAKKIYEDRTKCKITDVSCVQHPIHKFLGASPDGLIVPDDEKDVKRYGRLVEFKCPISRPMKPEIPPGYVHQMQMQMECTGIDECEYVEFRFKQVNYSEYTKTTAENKGAFTVYEDGRVVYDVEIYEDDTQVIYWILSSIKEDFVPKDLMWLPNHLEGLSKFWDEVLDHRKNGTKPEEKEKKVNASLDL
jgi:putative phage-type endonuclease